MTPRERKTAAKQKFRAKQQELGLCLDCNNKPSAGRARCENCLALRRNNLTERKRIAVERGACAYCLQEVSLPHHRFCEKCYCRDVSWHRLGTSKRASEILRLFNSQEGKCAISGVTMTLGMDCELDHIIPKSRGGSDDTENLQWVLMVCNRMKDNLTEDELFGMTERIYHTLSKKRLNAP